MSKKFLTTAIDYVNSVPHIGTAYEKIGADVLARFWKLCGDDVLLQMGNDEHSANVQKAAEAKGLAPKTYCDDMRPKFEEVWRKLNIDNDYFIQTSEPKHHAAVEKFFNAVKDTKDANGEPNIYQRDYEGWYCESCEAFYTEKDLQEGACPNHKTKPRWLKESNYFFRMKGKEKWLLDYIKAHPDFILPAKRRNEVVSFLEGGLEDLSISRSSFTWGIPLPIDKSQVIYVWFDALINYLTMLDYANDTDDLRKNAYWQNVTHIVGKDITRFHCVIWPLMLQAAGVPLPKQIFGHGFVYLRGEKMSKSLGNVVTPLDVLEKYPDFGADALRYYLMRTSSFGDDGDFTWEGFIARYNADLANGLGNLVSRILGMVWKYQGGKVYKLPSGSIDNLLVVDSSDTQEALFRHLDPLKCGDIESHLALEKIWAYVTKVDQYIDQKAPWKLAKEGKTEELSVVLTTVVEAVRKICLFVYPFVPAAAEKIWQAYGFDLGRGKIGKQELESSLNDPTITQNPESQLKEQKLNLFPRIVTEEKKA